MRLRMQPTGTRSIRALLVVLFVVPLVSLLALWGFAAIITLARAVQEHNFTNQDQLYGSQAQTLGTELALERSASFVWLSTEGRAQTGPLISQRKLTDKAVATFIRGVSAPGIIIPSARPALANFLVALHKLGAIRTTIDARRLSPLAAFEQYNAIVDAQFKFYDQSIVVSDVSLYRQEAASLEAGRAIELADREVTLVNGALAGGRMNRSERILFAQLVAEQRALMSDALQKLQPSLSAGYRSLETSPTYREFTALENKIIASIGIAKPIPVTQNEWTTTTFPLFSGFAKAEGQDRLALASAGTSVGDRLLFEVLLAGAVGMAAVGLLIFLMARFGRQITNELTDLQRAALDLATERLPLVVERLSRGEDIDVPAEPDLPAGRITEIARVAEAFSSVRRTAEDAAAGQARLRQGVSQVFRNLAWRNQSLLHRQLALLDAMERRSTEPEMLEELFRLDHLTTRMRRHAEGLIILSGAPPGRGWREPVPLVDVLRGAVAEVEDYTRVSVIARSDDAVVGAAVADLIHLLAELIENAATNSPTRTEVTVQAERVAHGIAIEIEDRGLGMNEEEIEAANERFAKTPEFDLADSDKLGFFVVARLAARHQIKVTLRSSPYGGVTAIVLMPHAITIQHAEDSDDALPDRLSLPAGAGHVTTGDAMPSGSSRVPSAELEPLLMPAPVTLPEPWLMPAPISTAPVDTAPVSATPSSPTTPDWPTALDRPTTPDWATALDRPTTPDWPIVPAGPADTIVPDGVGPLPEGMLTWVPLPEPGDDTLSEFPELPQRIRQTSLHPELRKSVLPPADQPPADQRPAGQSPAGQPQSARDVTAERSPVESGALFASLQRGWQRGRTEAEQAEQAEDGTQGHPTQGHPTQGSPAQGHPRHGYPADGHEQRADGHEQRADGHEQRADG